MKTLKLFIVLCIIFAFSTNNANSQKVIGEQYVYWRFTPDPGPFQIPCLTEAVSGSVFELQSFTNKTYHVMPRGVLIGETSGEEYTLDYEYYQFVEGESGATFRFNLPMLLKHDGKLIAVIHYAGKGIFNGQGELVVSTFTFKVNCK